MEKSDLMKALYIKKEEVERYRELVFKVSLIYF